MAMASMAAFLRRYYVPLILFSLGLFFQLVVLPSSYPASHYDVLGVRRFANINEVNEAYEKLSSKWSSGVEVPTSAVFIKVRYAFELLTNPPWKRDYDLFGIDEHSHLIGKLQGQYARESFSDVNLPLLNATLSGTVDHAFNALAPEEFSSLIGNGNLVLIQVYSAGSHRCAKFTNSWKRIATLLDGVADTGMVEVGEVQVASFIAERRATGQPFFRNGLPALAAIPPNCRSSDCLVRYHGDLSVDAVVDWMAASLLGLPRIPYYSKETLGPNFIGKTGPHKVKVIGFSKTGERAPPYLRQAAKDYGVYASFAFILWREGEAPIWWNTFNVETAPAIVFLKDPGVEPTVYHGSLNSSYFSRIMEQNKYFELPQLRSVTSMELGCDARGYSRAGEDKMTWYCVILAGRPSLELSRMRKTMRRAQNLLAHNVDPDFAENFSIPVPAVAALNEKRLTFAWLDGEVQKDYCFFYLHSDTIYETCGPRRYEDPVNVPRLFIVRYKRNSIESDLQVEKKAKRRTIWDTLNEEDVNKASQLVARYNGTEDLQEIVLWISKIIEDGDTRNLPDFTASTPQLTPESDDPILSRGAHNVVSSGKGFIQRIQGIISNVAYYLADPRVGPSLLLAACLSFGSIWFQGTRTTHPSKKVEGTNEMRRPRGPSVATSNENRPSSITDAEPQDAYQMSATDSESE